MSNNLPETVSNKFRNLSVVCAFFVVIIHCYPGFMLGQKAWFVYQFLGNGICEMAVPFFFLTSGFFIAERIDCGEYKREVSKRIKTLLYPFVVWLLLYLIFQTCMKRQLFVPSMSDLGLDMRCTPALHPLWYVRALFCLVVMSPIIVFCLKKNSVITLSVAGILYGLICPYAPMPGWNIVKHTARVGPMPVLGLFYFSLGLAIRLRLIDVVVKRWFLHLCLALGLGFVVARIVALSCGCGWVGAYCGFASIPFLIIGFWNAIPDRLWPAAIITSSFPIYLIHMFFYPIVDLCCNKNSPVGYIFEFSSVFVLSFTSIPFVI